MQSYIVISGSSDIGFEFIKNRSLLGENVIGTYRDKDAKDKLEEYCSHVIPLDLFSKDSTNNFIKYISNKKIFWDKILFCPCQTFPYKSFFECDFQEWNKSFKLNSTYQLELLHKLYVFRKTQSKVIFFAGGGSNSAVDKFSAYTSAKIHLTKMIELLDFENKDITFSIIGPGWVNTKNHLTALKYADKDSEKYITTKKFLESPKGATPIEEVVRSINWIFNQKKKIVGGRNFSTAFDPWGEDHPLNSDLLKNLDKDDNIYKLRRFGNDLFPNKRY